MSQDIKRAAEQLLGNHISEDKFIFELNKYMFHGGYQAVFTIAQALSLGLVPEGGDGA